MREWVEECNARTVSLPYALVPTGTGTAAGVASFFRIDTDHGAPGCSLSSTAGRCSR